MYVFSFPGSTGILLLSPTSLAIYTDIRGILETVTCQLADSERKHRELKAHIKLEAEQIACKRIVFKDKNVTEKVQTKETFPPHTLL